jgi:ATP-dependent Lon protease
LAEIPNEVQTKMDIIPVSKLEEVLKIALVRMPESITLDEVAEAEALEAKDSDKAGSRVTAH